MSEGNEIKPLVIQNESSTSTGPLIPINEIQKKIAATKRKFSELKESFEQKMKGLEQELDEVENETKKIKILPKKVQEKIKLNIGGKVFVTTRSTLTNVSGTFFSGMFSGNFDETPDEDGEYFIDRNPRFFELILEHLRGVDVKPILKKFSDEDLHLFNQEVSFYQIQPLIEDDDPDWTLDPLLCSKSIALSDDNLTATKQEHPKLKEPAVVVGSKGFSRGKNIWEIKINSMKATYTKSDDNIWGTAVGGGIIDREHISMDFSDSGYKDNGHWCSNNPLIGHEMIGSGSNWEAGHIVRMELDFDEEIFKVTQEKSGTKVYCVGNLQGKKWYPFFMLPTPGDSITLRMVEVK